MSFARCSATSSSSARRSCTFHRSPAVRCRVGCRRCPSGPDPSARKSSECLSRVLRHNVSGFSSRPVCQALQQGLAHRSPSIRAYALCITGVFIGHMVGGPPLPSQGRSAEIILDVAIVAVRPASIRPAFTTSCLLAEGLLRSGRDLTLIRRWLGGLGIWGGVAGGLLAAALLMHLQVPAHRTAETPSPCAAGGPGDRPVWATGSARNSTV